MFNFDNACEFVGLHPEAKLNLDFKYREPHRFYHNLDHINQMLATIMAQKNEFSESELQILVLATLYHDSIYSVDNMKTNEEDSAAYMLEQNKGMDEGLLKEAFRLIMLTSHNFNHLTDEEDVVGYTFLKADLIQFYGSFKQLLEYDDKVFKEFQKFDLVDFQKGRLAAINNLSRNSILRDDPIAQTNLDYLMDYTMHKKYKIGLYAGSFNPFHMGHLNILQKGEKIFDKMILGFAQDPAKSLQKMSVPRALKHYQIEPIEGYLVDFVESKPYDITIVKGLRNTADMRHELNQYKFMQEQASKPLSITTIFCDREYDHLSSTALRNIRLIGSTVDPLYLKYVVN